MRNFKDSDGQNSFPQLKTDVTTKWRNHHVPIPSQRNIAILICSAFPQLPLCLVWGHRIPGCRSPRPSCPSSRSLFSVSGYHSKLFTCKSGVPLSRTDLYPNKLVSEYQSLHQLHFLRRQKFWIGKYLYCLDYVKGANIFLVMLVMLNLTMMMLWCLVCQCECGI